MTILRALLDRPRLVITTALLLALAGAISWATMPREEDPQFPSRNAFVVTAFPGADAEAVERLVTDPIEERLSEVEEVAWMDSSSRAGASIVYVELDDGIYDTEPAWDEVEDALTKAGADRGLELRKAAATSARELAVPLGTATATTLAAFVPMLLAKGEAADFTRSIPVVIILTLSVSYLFALTATPVLSRFFLRRKPAGRGNWGHRLAGPIARIAVGRPGWVLLAAGVLLLVTLFASGRLERRFFPIADRNVVLVDLQMPEGTHLERTDAVAREIESALLGRPDVSSVATFLGRATPRFYYNLPSHPRSPHRAQLLAQTHSLDAVGRVLEWTRELALSQLPEAEVVLRRLEQGPPMEAPIKLRLSGHDLEDLERAAEALVAELRKIPGARDVRHNLGLGTPTIVFRVDDAAAGRYGLSRSDVAEVLLGRTLGLPVGQYRAGEDPVPIVVRSGPGVELPVSQLHTLQVAAPGGEGVPLGRIARSRIEWRPATIHHLWRDRYVKVLAQLEEGVTASVVLEQLRPRLPELELPSGVRLQLSGEAEESGKANAAILRAMPLGALLLLFFLLAEFNSFRRVGPPILSGLRRAHVRSRAGPARARDGACPRSSACLCDKLLLQHEPDDLVDFLTLRYQGPAAHAVDAGGVWLAQLGGGSSLSRPRRTKRLRTIPAVRPQTRRPPTW